MRTLQIRYLILLSSILGGCATAYKDMQLVGGDTGCVQQFVPTYQKNWFTASIDVQGHHLSGLLLIKKMPDGADRIVFINELGVTFFDFEFSDKGFKVIQVIDKLNIKAVISTLRQDFELLLLRGLKNESLIKYNMMNDFYYAFPWDSKINYIITDNDCKLMRLERGSKKKKLVQIGFVGEQENPEKIIMQHFNFKMQITLTKIER